MGYGYRVKISCLMAFDYILTTMLSMGIMTLALSSMQSSLEAKMGIAKWICQQSINF